jgi:hypothetical protein
MQDRKGDISCLILQTIQRLLKCSMTLNDSVTSVDSNGCHSMRRTCTTTLVESGVHLISGIITTTKNVVIKTLIMENTLTKGSNNEYLAN